METFSHRSWIHFDELDPQGILHNSRYAVHVERATSHFFGSRGWRYGEEFDDSFHVLREFHIEFLAPFAGGGELEVELWVQRMGTTSCTYGFRCRRVDGDLVVATGRRTIVKLDRTTFQPAPWSATFVAGHDHLLLEQAA